MVVAFHGAMRLGAVWVGVNRALAPPEKRWQLADCGASLLLDRRAARRRRRAGGRRRRLAGGARRRGRRSGRRGRRPVRPRRHRLHQRHHRPPQGRGAQPAQPAAARRGAGREPGLRARAAQGRLLPVHDPQHGRADHPAGVAGRRDLDRDGPHRRRGRGRVDPARAGHHLERPARPALQPRPPGRHRPVRPRQPRRGVDRAAPTAPRPSARRSRPSSACRCWPPTGCPRPPRWWRSTAAPARPRGRRRRADRCRTWPSASPATTGRPCPPARRARSASGRPTTATARCSATGSAPTPPPRRWPAASCTPATSAFLDDDGRLHVRDRKSLVILRGGANVYPAEVERVLLDHPAVDAGAVLGRARRAAGRAGGGRGRGGRRGRGRRRRRARPPAGQPGQVQGARADHGGRRPAPQRHGQDRAHRAAGAARSGGHRAG